MPRHATKFVAAIFVSLASLSLVTMARGEPTTAPSCQSAPGSETPSGSHWRYRVDHANKRNCWYLGRADGLSHALRQSSSQTPAQPPRTPVQAAKPSVADAHAELRSRAANDDNAAATPPATVVANEPSPESPSVPNPAPTIATRWPELPPAYQMPRAEPAVASSADNNTAQTPTEAPQATAEPAAFGYFSLPIRSETIPTLLAAILAALAFGSAAALISRRMGQMRRLRRRVTNSTAAPLSETTDDDRIILSDIPEPRDYRPRFGRNVRTSAVADDRSQEFVRRAPLYAQR
jgi:hypothetical protein